MSAPDQVLRGRQSPVGAATEWIQSQSLVLRITAVVVLIGAAYHYTFATLLNSLGLDTPLAYLGLVPFMAFGLALVKGRPQPNEPAIHDRQIDVLIGAPLVIGAVLIETMMPARLSSLFWLWRVDILSLPLFVAGVVTLAFGVRTLWRLRFPIAFLLLAWPLTYTSTLKFWLNACTNLTLGALHRALAVVAIAKTTPGSDRSLFTITHHGHPFVLSVASACSGVNSGVGFLLLGIAFTALVRGRRLPKLLWLGGGLALVWVLNLFRLLLIFWAGSSFGEGFAIDGLHPYIGLVLFCVGVAAMLAAMPLFRLHIPLPQRASADLPETVQAPPEHKLAVPRAKAILAILGVVAIWMGIANQGLKQYQLVAGDLGAPRLVSFEQDPAAVPNYSVSREAEYDWAQRFFGSDSSWIRYLYTPAKGTSTPVTADVVTTSALQRFSDYGIEACYHFHGYEVLGDHAFTVGGGVTAQVLTYMNSSGQDQWNVVYWIWPVSTPNGRRFERVVLLEQGTAKVPAAAVGGSQIDAARRIGIDAYNASLGYRGGALTHQLDAGRSFLVDFADELVAHRATAPTGSPS